jgi:hypothetical protein
MIRVRRELGFKSGEVAPLPAALDTVYTIDTYSLYVHALCARKGCACVSGVGRARKGIETCPNVDLFGVQ